MEIIRERHKKTREELKELLVELVQNNNFGSSLNWNGFEFEGKAYKTAIRGEIFDDELYIELSGWFEKKAAQKLRELWKELVVNELV